MRNVNLYIIYNDNETPKPSLLKEIFDKYADDTISDEQIERVLEPIFEKIQKGEFDKKRSPVVDQLKNRLSAFFVL